MQQWLWLISGVLRRYCGMKEITSLLEITSFWVMMLRWTSFYHFLALNKQCFFVYITMYLFTEVYQLCFGLVWYRCQWRLKIFSCDRQRSFHVLTYVYRETSCWYLTSVWFNILHADIATSLLELLSAWVSAGHFGTYSLRTRIFFWTLWFMIVFKSC